MRKVKIIPCGESCDAAPEVLKTLEMVLDKVHEKIEAIEDSTNENTQEINDVEEKVADVESNVVELERKYNSLFSTMDEIEDMVLEMRHALKKRPRD